MKSLPSLNVIISFVFQKRKQIYYFLLSKTSFAKISYHLHHAVIFISNVQIPASVESKLIVDLNSNCHDCSIQKNREKVQWIWQADMVEFLIDERKLSMMKLDYICSHLSTTFNTKKLFNAFHKEWLAPSTTLTHKMARGIRRTV